jgi:hypothetical protein
MSSTTPKPLLVVKRDGELLLADVCVQCGDDEAFLGRALVLAMVTFARAFDDPQATLTRFIDIALDHANYEEARLKLHGIGQRH